MRKSRLFASIILLAIGVTPAWAGSLAGRSTLAGQAAPAGVGTVGTIGGAPSLNVYVPGATDNSAGSVSASANGVNVQTNIDNSKTIDASTNLNVTETVNGANVAYGGTGVSVYGFQSNALGVINTMANENAGATANNGPNFTAVTDALEQATFLQNQQNGN